MRRVDIAWFECKCGHRCTPPEEINAIASQMEICKVEAMTKTDLEKAHPGNIVTVESAGRVKFARSYAKATHDKTELAESDHIILACPQCDAVLYDVSWRKRR